MSSGSPSRRPGPSSGRPRERVNHNRRATDHPTQRRTADRRAAAQPPPAAGVRGAVERVSARPLVVLSGGPRWLPPLVLGVLLVFGMAFPGPVGIAALMLVLAFVVWLVYLSWPVLAPAARLLRLAVAGLLVAVIAVRMTTA